MQIATPIPAAARRSSGSTIPVRLRPGLNRFYAMAGRPDPADVEGRSEVVEVRYEGAEPAGRLHVLALGVSDVPAAATEPSSSPTTMRSDSPISSTRAASAAAAPGLTIVLTNDEVNEARVDEAFVAAPRAGQGPPRRYRRGLPGGPCRHAQ